MNVHWQHISHSHCASLILKMTQNIYLCVCVSVYQCMCCVLLHDALLCSTLHVQSHFVHDLFWHCHERIRVEMELFEGYDFLCRASSNCLDLRLAFSLSSLLSLRVETWWVCSTVLQSVQAEKQTNEIDANNTLIALLLLICKWCRVSWVRRKRSYIYLLVSH